MNTKIIRTDEEQKRANEIHDKYRDELLKRQLYNTEHYDKTILTLSSSGLAISLTFLNLVIPNGSAKFAFIIQSAWVCFLLSIILSLCAYHVSNKVIDRYLINAERYYLEGDESACNPKDLLYTINKWLNYMVGFLFCVAITGVVAFVIVNLSLKEEDMTSKKVETSHPVMAGDSALPPRMQQFVGNESAQPPRMQVAPGTKSTAPSVPPSPTNTTPKENK
ncbi:hypothetical protein [Aeromonas sp.]|uniref:hypothetical protein n=1 Tax=Aeromonas sp. TaxID=647 RepID=UPI00258B5A4D|nr:hypothetical protein [Aeromonas sp.]MCX7132378.1 hypothetical protein [Aeromonas sp.]